MFNFIVINRFNAVAEPLQDSADSAVNGASDDVRVRKSPVQKLKHLMVELVHYRYDTVLHFTCLKHTRGAGSCA